MDLCRALGPDHGRRRGRPQRGHRHGGWHIGLGPSFCDDAQKNDPRRCLRRSRGGLGTKIHALTNQDGLPIRFELTPGQAHDAPVCRHLLGALQPGQVVLAYKAYDVDWIREIIWKQGAIDVIPSKSSRKMPKDFNADIYKDRNKIERFFGRLKASFRRIATRYEKNINQFHGDDQTGVGQAVARVL